MKYIRILAVFILVIGVGCGFQKNRVEFSPESEDFYEEARLIMTGEERKIFNHLPDKESRQEFIKDFWEKRDPTPNTELNEYKEEFYDRIEYANERFIEGIPGWKTDRGRIYIHFGFPDRIEQRPMMNRPDIKGYLLWIYYRYNLAVEFIDKRGDNAYVLNPYSGIYGSLFEAMEMAKLGISYTNNELGRKYIDFQLDFDRQKKKLSVLIPVKDLSFVEQDGMLKAEFEFQFYVYADKKNAQKKTFMEKRQFQATEQELLDMEEISFSFSFDLKPGKYFVDVVLNAKPDIGKSRKIFKIKN